jgi:hypothetical protein
MTAVREHTVPQPMVFSINPLLRDKIEQTKGNLAPLKHLQLTLTDARLVITDSAAYGSVLLGYLPDSNFMFIGGEGKLTCVKDGAGIVTGELPKLAVGTAAASNATLSSTMINLINGGSGGTALASGLSATWYVHSNDNVTAVPYVGIADGATTGLYLNGAVNPTGDGYLTITGTIDLYFIDLGNTTS